MPQCLLCMNILGGQREAE